MAYLPEPIPEEKIKSTPVAEIRKEYAKLAVNYNHLKDCDYLYCHKCNSFMSQEAFYQHKEYASGFFPICKRCLAELATDYDKKNKTYTDNKEKTINVLHMMNLPYLSDLYKSAQNALLNQDGERQKTTAYKYMIAWLYSLPNYRNMTWKDSVFDEEPINDNSNRKPRKEIMKIFGSGFSEGDYLYLQDQYDDWKARTQIDSKSQETYIIRICFKLLDIWKAQKEGKDTKDLDKSLNDLMAAANLQPKQNVSNASTDSLTFGQLIEKWEQEKPISEPSEEFKDVDNIGKYIRVWFGGWLAKAIGIKNQNSIEFEEEVKKYTATKPNFDDSEDGGADQIYDKMFGSVGD